MAFITTVDAVKTIIPNQSVVNYLVKDWIIEDKIRNVTVFIQGFLRKDYKIGEALVPSLLGFDLGGRHIGILEILETFYVKFSGYEYTPEYPQPPISLTENVDFVFKNEPYVLDDIYNVPAYTFGLARAFIEDVVYENSFIEKEDLGYIQYKVVGGNDDESTYNLSLQVLGDKPFFMDSKAQQLLINAGLAQELDLSSMIQLLATYIVAKDVIVEYILPVFRQDTANNLAGVRLDAEDLLPGFEEFIKSLDDKIADIWALLKYRGKITVNPDGPDGPDDSGPFADQARTVVRGEKNYPFSSPFGDSEHYARRSPATGYRGTPQQYLDSHLSSDPFGGI